MVSKGPARRPAIDRFWEKVDNTDTCWLWTGSQNGRGYPVFSRGGRHSRVYAHRWAYEYFVGPIPEGLQLDHVRARGCLHRHCVNPAHLEPVTNAENSRRGDSGWGPRNRRKTHCSEGHPYSGSNLYVDSAGHRHCRKCLARYARDYRARKKQKSDVVRAQAVKAW